MYTGQLSYKVIRKAWLVRHFVLGSFLFLVAGTLFIGSGCSALRLNKSQGREFLNPGYLSAGGEQNEAGKEKSKSRAAKTTEVAEETAKQYKRGWYSFGRGKDKDASNDAPSKAPEARVEAEPAKEKKGWWIFSRNKKSKVEPGVDESIPPPTTAPAREPAPDQAADVKPDQSESGIIGSLLSRKKKQEESKSPPPPTAEEIAAIDAEAARATAASVSSESSASVNLRPGLLLEVKVMVAGKNQLEPGAIRISDQGSIFLPMLGSVPANNITLDVLRDDLTTRYRRYYVNPEVLVDFARDTTSEGLSPWGYVTVLGRVKNPGRIMIPATRDLTVSGAIQGAGGFDKSARINAISVTRRNADGKGQTQRIVNLNEVGSDGKAEDDFILGADDVVFVPEARF